MKTIRGLTNVKPSGLILLATYLLVGAANAGPIYQGKFTLPYEVKWGKAVLSPGEYRLTLLKSDTDGRWITTVEPIQRKATLCAMPIGVSEHHEPGPDALVIDRLSNQSTVRELRLADLGLALHYERQELGSRKTVREARAEQKETLVAVNR